MDLDDFTPAGAGSLRSRPVSHAGQKVATFTPPRTLHPDEIWNPRSTEIYGHRPWRPGSEAEHRQAEHADQAPHEQTARMVRSALQPGA